MPGVSPGLRNSTFCASGASMRNVTHRSAPISGDTTVGCDPRCATAAIEAATQIAHANGDVERFISPHFPSFYGSAFRLDDPRTQQVGTYLKNASDNPPSTGIT